MEMADLTTITAALTGLKTATDIARMIGESSATLEDAEFKFKLAELLEALANARAEVAEVKSEMLEKERIITDLRSQLELAKNIVWDSPYYWIKENGEQDGPYCQKCYDSDGKLIRLQSRWGREGAWDCHACSGFFTDSTYVPPKPKRRKSVY